MNLNLFIIMLQFILSSCSGGAVKYKAKKDIVYREFPASSSYSYKKNDPESVKVHIGILKELEKSFNDAKSFKEKTHYIAKYDNYFSPPNSMEKLELTLETYAFFNNKKYSPKNMELISSFIDDFYSTPYLVNPKMSYFRYSKDDFSYFFVSNMPRERTSTYQAPKVFKFKVIKGKILFNTYNWKMYKIEDFALSRKQLIDTWRAEKKYHINNFISETKNCFGRADSILAYAKCWNLYTSMSSFRSESLLLEDFKSRSTTFMHVFCSDGDVDCSLGNSSQEPSDREFLKYLSYIYGHLSGVDINKMTIKYKSFHQKKKKKIFGNDYFWLSFKDKDSEKIEVVFEVHCDDDGNFSMNLAYLVSLNT